MKRHGALLIACGTLAVLAPGCATKKFVREQVGATETKIVQRVDTQETRLRETSDRTAANSQAIDAASQRIQAVDTRVGEVSTVATDAKGLAGDAKKQAEAVSSALKETETQFTQRFANRNKYSTLETKTIYFDSNRADLKDEGINELQDVANALKADPNAVVELQGFADPRGSDRYNYQLTRERVDAVVRNLVQRHGIDLRRIHAVGMGKAVQETAERATRDTFAKSRRVDIRLLAPQS